MKAVSDTVLLVSFASLLLLDSVQATDTPRRLKGRKSKSEKNTRIGSNLNSRDFSNSGDNNEDFYQFTVQGIIDNPADAPNDNLRAPDDNAASVNDNERKDDKYNDDVYEPPLRRSASSLIFNIELETFLGGVRFTGEICLKESLCDPVDFQYREDSLLEAYDRSTNETLGFCLTYPTYGSSNYLLYGTGLTMSACVEDSDEQEWRFLRTPVRVPLISLDPPLPAGQGVYMIYNPASDVVIAAAHDSSWYDNFPFVDDIFANDKDNKDQNNKYQDNDKYADDEDITAIPLDEAEATDEKVLWTVNEQRFFRFNNTLFDILDDDIFGSVLSVYRSNNSTNN